MPIRKRAQTLLESESRTATTVSAVLSGEEVYASVFIVDVTALSLTPSIVLTIEGKDPVSGAFFTVIEGSAITTVSTTPLQAGIASNLVLPSEYRVTVTHADTDAITYTVSAIHTAFV